MRQFQCLWSVWKFERERKYKDQFHARSPFGFAGGNGGWGGNLKTCGLIFENTKISPQSDRPWMGDGKATMHNTPTVYPTSVMWRCKGFFTIPLAGSEVPVHSRCLGMYGGSPWSSSLCSPASSEERNDERAWDSFFRFLHFAALVKRQPLLFPPLSVLRWSLWEARPVYWWTEGM